MSVSASYGIMACAVCLLMISGEVDLSSGVMTGSTGLLLGLLISEVGMGDRFQVWPREAFHAHRAAAREAAMSGLADLRMTQRARLAGGVG